MNINKNIILFYPSKIVGGAEFLFIRLARFLVEQGMHVFYVDYVDGLARKQLLENDIVFVDYEDNKKTVVDIEGTLITPISNFYRIKNFLEITNQNTKLLFWCLHYHNIIDVCPEGEVLTNLPEKVVPFFVRHFCKNTFNVYRNVLLNLDKLQSVYFMDEMTFALNRRIFSYPFSQEIPILSLRKDTFAKEEVINKDEINVCYLGRLCKEKVYPLINVLDNLLEISTNKKINVHIIGEGDSKKLINEKKYKDKLNLLFIGTLSQEEMNKYLKNKIDILFAMGTAALEGCALKLPVVFLNPSYKKIHGKIFHFMDHYNNFNLKNNLNGFSMQEIIDMIYVHDKKSEIGQKCLQYYEAYHSPEAVIAMLLKAIEKNELTLYKYNQIIKSSGILKKNKNIIYKLFKKIIKWRKL